jgi:AcrR family transcriptional regulator
MNGVPARTAPLPRVLRLLWGREETRRPGPKPAISIELIGTAATKIADANGLSAVSMNRVARDLGFTPMSLYRYVDSKSDLFVVMLDQVYGRPAPALPPGTPWRVQLASWAHANRAAVLNHPWVLQIPLVSPPLGPNGLAWLEQGLQALASTGLDEAQKMSVIMLVEVLVRGQTLLTIGIDGETSPAVPVENGQYGRMLFDLVDEERFPRIWSALRSGALEDEDPSPEDSFLSDLTTLLDGIEARIDRMAERDATGRGRSTAGQNAAPGRP